MYVLLVTVVVYNVVEELATNVLCVQLAFYILIMFVMQIVLTDFIIMLTQEIQYVLHVTLLV